jgi:CubicO group peptidase (beta-lactamase class C family)
VPKRKIYMSIGVIGSVVLLTAVWQGGVISKARTATAILLDEGPGGLARKLTGQPGITWESAEPRSMGLDPARLDSLIDALRSRATDVFLVVRNGVIVSEWYGPGYGPDTPFGMAAMAKAVTGSMALLLTVSDGCIDLDDRVAEYYSGWLQDSTKSHITIRQLASHSSGLDDVDFTDASDGWKQYYYQHPDERFQLALERAPSLFDAGEHQLYSGLGYYALAYALTKSRRGLPQDDLGSLLRERLFEPLEVPRRAWGLSYGESYDFDGMRLYAIGSGAAITARAAARVGQLVLNRGAWRGTQLIPARWVDTLRSQEPLPAEQRVDSTELGVGLGWWRNRDQLLTSLPSDAMVGLGNGDRVLLVVPSLDLVMVRSGDLLAPAEGAAIWRNPWSRLDEHLFGPLMAAIIDSQPLEN